MKTETIANQMFSSGYCMMDRNLMVLYCIRNSIDFDHHPKICQVFFVNCLVGAKMQPYGCKTVFSLNFLNFEQN